MKKLLFLCGCAMVFGCGQSSDSSPEALSGHSVADDTVTVCQPLAPIETGEVFLKGKDPFGGIQDLTGENKTADTVIFKISGTQALVKDGVLAMKNRHGRNSIMLFGLPELKFITSTGPIGDGPDEFKYPALVPAQSDTSLLCYVYDAVGETFYTLSNDGVLESYPFNFGESSVKYASRSVANVAPGDFIYAQNTSEGRSVFRATVSGDSVAVRKVFDLALSPGQKSWAAYIGDFAVNPAKDRMVYAYKYFKVIKFMDMNGKSVRTLNFEKEKFDQTSIYKLNGLDANVTHYWGVSPTDDYVYFLYSGRTPADVVREQNQGEYYIYVEKYDWNGNPVACYKLDRWGYFTVDGNNGKLYLMSTNDDDPFFVYDIN